MAEYEALLMGLQLVLELNVKVIQIYSDFKLVVNQVNSLYEVIEPTMVKYAAMVSELKSQFQKFTSIRFPHLRMSKQICFLNLPQMASRRGG